MLVCDKKQGRSMALYLRKAGGDKYVHTHIQICMSICMYLLIFKNRLKKEGNLIREGGNRVERC